MWQFSDAYFERHGHDRAGCSTQTSRAEICVILVGVGAVQGRVTTKKWVFSGLLENSVKGSYSYFVNRRRNTRAYPNGLILAVDPQTWGPLIRSVTVSPGIDPTGVSKIILEAHNNTMRRELPRSLVKFKSCAGYQSI